MERGKTDLSRLQRWMQTAVTRPGGPGPGDGVESVIRPSATLTSAERLAIYSRGYRARLLECFRAEFPCLLHACGDELFRRFVDDYLERYPPKSYTLNLLAEAFPRHLAETRPDADAPPERRESWPDFLVDLATLERAFNEVYDGPGIEGLELPSAGDLGTMAASSLGRARFEPAPCLRLLSFRYPVDEYFTAVRRGEDPPLPAASECHVALDRRSYTVRLHRLSRGELELFSALSRGLTVSEASASLSPLEVRERLEEGLERGFFLAIVPG